MQIECDEAISMTEVIKCENMQFTINKGMPSINVEHSQGVRVLATLASKNNISINTTCSQSVSMVYPRDEGSYDPNNEEEPTEFTGVCPESFSNKLIDGKFVTNPFDLND